MTSASPPATVAPSTLSTNPTPPTTQTAPTAAQTTPTNPAIPDADSREPVTVTVVYDNRLLQSRSEDSLLTGWGFACLIQTADITVLFDTGRDGSALLNNLRILEIEPASIDAVIVSHNHSDHTGGLSGLLEQAGPIPVYCPASCAEALARTTKSAGATIVPVREALAIGNGLWLTGELGGKIKEQGLVVDTAAGPLLITGCAHPGLVNMVERAAQQAAKPIYMVLGGFHLSALSAGDAHSLAERLKELRVVRFAPAHCTGKRATAVLHEEFGAGFVPIGVGAVVTL